MCRTKFDGIKTYSTRYRGSKRKIIDWLLENVKDSEFNTVLDAFGGTGVVSYMFKQMGKNVTYNDNLKFNYFIGKSLIENDYATINQYEIRDILSFKENKHPDFIKKTFADVFYLNEENEWLDSIVYNINNYWNKEESYKKYIAFNALFQSCLVKRPYNLFHRKNLNMRITDVNRTFGNKVTWDSTFELHFEKFINEINNYVFSNGAICKAQNEDVFKINNVDFDLVYLDPPYIQSKNSAEEIDYLKMYHFLEGISNYSDWETQINWHSNIRNFKPNSESLQFTKKNAEFLFVKLIEKFKDSIIVLSYKSNGIPSVEWITDLLYSYKKNVKITTRDYKYALNKKSSNPGKEVLFVAK